MAIHHEAIKKEKFNEDLTVREDAEFLDRFRYCIPCYHIKNKSAVLHRHDNSITGNPVIVKREMEKSIYFYIRTRKRVTMAEFSKLYEIYNILLLHSFRERKSGKTLSYFFKTMLLTPVCLVHYPSLKKTLNRISALKK